MMNRRKLKLSNFEEYKNEEGYPYIFLPELINILSSEFYSRCTTRNAVWMMNSLNDEEDIYIDGSHHNPMRKIPTKYLNLDIQSDQELLDRIDVLRNRRNKVIIDELEKVGRFGPDVGRLIISFQDSRYPHWDNIKDQRVLFRSSSSVWEDKFFKNEKMVNEFVIKPYHPEGTFPGSFTHSNRAYLGFFENNILVDPVYSSNFIKEQLKSPMIMNKVFMIKLDSTIRRFHVACKRYDVVILYEKFYPKQQYDSETDESEPDINIEEEVRYGQT